jgi:hypothetical protein
MLSIISRARLISMNLFHSWEDKTLQQMTSYLFSAAFLKYAQIKKMKFKGHLKFTRMRLIHALSTWTMDVKTGNLTRYLRICSHKFIKWIPLFKRSLQSTFLTNLFCTKLQRNITESKISSWKKRQSIHMSCSERVNFWMYLQFSYWTHKHKSR